MVIFAVVNADANCFGSTISNHFLSQLHGGFRGIFTVNRRNQATDDAKVALTFVNAFNDGSLGVFVAVVTGKTGVIPEKFCVANAMLFAVS